MSLRKRPLIEGPSGSFVKLLSIPVILPLGSHETFLYVRKRAYLFTINHTKLLRSTASKRLQLKPELSNIISRIYSLELFSE